MSGLTFKQLTTVCWNCGFWPVRIGKDCPACRMDVDKPIEQITVEACQACKLKRQQGTKCPWCGEGP